MFQSCNVVQIIKVEMITIWLLKRPVSVGLKDKNGLNHKVLVLVPLCFISQLEKANKNILDFKIVPKGDES